MERALSPEEKIRRAEEIYYRRKMLEGNRNYARVKVTENKKDFRIFKKMIFQILICSLIYSSFNIVKNKEYIFSEDIINKTKEILSYDINIPKLYQKLKEYLNSFTYNEKAEQKQENEENIENKENTETINQEEIIEQQDNNEITDAIGGEIVQEVQEETVLTQMEQDAKDIKETASLIIPLTGTITSRFGPRNSENPIVSKNHTGIDIAREEGTVFIAAMDGTVEIVSNVRGIGESFKNSKW